MSLMFLSGRRRKWNKPEDLPVSVFAAFGNKSLGIVSERFYARYSHFVFCCCFFEINNRKTMKKQYQAVTAAEAVKVIKSGDHVHISSDSNVPQCLVKALCDRGRAGELKNVYIHHLHTEGAAPYVNPEFEGIFQHNAFFVGANVRESVQKGLADYIPVFLGETSKLYRERYIKCNVAMIQVSPPDKFGYVSLGSSVDATLAAMECADSLGDKIYSGVGGQIDFVYGASRAKGGKAIIAMPSTTRRGINKIVPALDLGSGAVTTRNHIHWFVTEYGAMNLYGRPLQERAKLIISIAHPQFQEELEKAAFQRFGPHYHYVCKNNIF